MRNTLLSLMVTAGAILSGCNGVKTTAVQDTELKNGFSLIDSNTVKLVKEDKIGQDAFANRLGSMRGSADGVNDRFEKASYYFKTNKDSSVVIAHGGFDNLNFSNPILYKDMEPSVKEYFSKAVAYAKANPQ